MRGLMMDMPLLTTQILEHAVRTTPNQEIVCRLVEGGIHRYTFADAGKRIAQLAHALVKLGVKPGDRVGVMGWNTHRQLELYYAVAGVGAICHTINPRLGPENAGFVMQHAEDKFVFFDATFSSLVDTIAPHLDCVKKYVAMTPAGETHKINGKKALCYEEIIAPHPVTYDWPTFDENTGCVLCYTSGTTGNPKGVLYSHRSQVLHALVTSLPTSIGIGPDDSLLVVVPMFHVNAWGLPYSALMNGVKIVFPGPQMDGPSLYDIIEQESVTYAVGVPTVWLNLLGHIEANDLKLSSLKYTLVGGAALSERIIEGYEKLGVRTRQGWGMTEMSPVGTINFEEKGFYDLPYKERLEIQLRQGKAAPFIDLRIVDDDGKPLPHDGRHDGYLHARGPWVLSHYYRMDKPATTKDGWFDTGDVAIIHPDGRMQITDRAKDVIKSGGEWISTIDIENAALSHPAVAQAAAIGMPHPKWLERPLLVVELKDGKSEDELPDILKSVRDKLPKISWPDDIVAVETIPIGATGKVLKRELREMLKDYKLPTA